MARRPGGVGLDQEQAGEGGLGEQHVEVGADRPLQELPAIALAPVGPAADGNVDLAADRRLQQRGGGVEGLEEAVELGVVLLVEGLPRHAGPLQHVGHRRGGVALLGHGLGQGEHDPRPLRGLDLLAAEPVAAPGQDAVAAPPGRSATARPRLVRDDPQGVDGGGEHLVVPGEQQRAR